MGGIWHLFRWSADSSILVPNLSYASNDDSISTIRTKNSQISLDLIRDELAIAKITAEESAEFNKKESERAEIFRMITFVHSEINTLHSSEVDSGAGATLGFFFSSSAPSKGMSSIPNNGDPVTDHDRVILADLCDYMMELNNYLNNYEGEFGASALTYYYKKRHGTASTRLFEKDFLLKSMLSAFDKVRYGWTAFSTSN